MPDPKTLLELAGEFDPDGKPAQVIEILVNHNPILAPLGAPEPETLLFRARRWLAMRVLDLAERIYPESRDA
jgi:hypothetical protein